jgi:hypothetical protein
MFPGASREPPEIVIRYPRRLPSVILMKLNHINLAVADVAATQGFFERYFDFHFVETKDDGILTILTDDAGFVLILSNIDRQVVLSYPR